MIRIDWRMCTTRIRIWISFPAKDIMTIIDDSWAEIAKKGDGNVKLLYPAIFYPLEKDEGYTVIVPDLPGCVSEGEDLANAIDMGTDAASGWVLDEMEDGNPIPPASDIKDMSFEKDGIVNLLVLDMDAYALKYGNKAINKRAPFRRI